ncbi:taste receptor type 2 member 40-like [Spea bombifrons]|uniref:taste receptor type 2 member 40-like n=1 Tax=Spea bombifrons TaxID=233779 RepID=UPI0023497D1C|nr:taste receptor type 2 member 40-like [Spea bombifrons]
MNPLTILSGIIALEILSGVLLNLFIALVCSKEWVTHGHLGLSDQILLIVGSSNLVLAILHTFNYLYFFFMYHLSFSGQLQKIATYFAFVSSICLSFSTAWLCIFYCIKVVKLQIPFATFLKTRFPKMLPRVMLLSMAGSALLCSFVSHYYFRNDAANHTLEAGHGSITAMKTDSLYYLFLFFGFCIPFVLVIAALAVTIRSLVLHIFRMQQTLQSVSHLHTHVGAIRTMTLLMGLYIFYYVSQVLLALDVFSEFSGWGYLCVITQYAYPGLKALLLILGNPKLRLKCTRRASMNIR